jgi:hypothetical protein
MSDVYDATPALESVAVQALMSWGSEMRMTALPCLAMVSHLT